MRGYAREDVVAKVRAAGGEIYAITSEPQRLASRAQKEWDFGFESIGDPHQEISHACAERGWLKLIVQERLGFLESSTRAYGTALAEHPKGYFQPGVLAVRADGRVLYRWRSIPNRQNIGGAVGRPTAAHVWSRVEAALAEPSTTGAAPDTDPPLDRRGGWWPLFVLLLIANGWFMRPRAFNQLPDGNFPTTRIRNAQIRLIAFVAAWGAALWWLPTWPVVLALGAWVVWITPKIRWLNLEFQNVSAKAHA